MTSKIDKKIGRTSGLPVYLQRKIKFVEAVGEDTSGKSSVGYGSQKKDTSVGAKQPANVLFDKSAMEKRMVWGKVFNIGPGLANLGNTCFLNSALQCLTYTSPLANLLLERVHGKRCTVDGFCIICELERHAQKCFTGPSGRRHISPNGIVANIKLIGKQFRLGRQEDAHEFIRYLVEAMQKVCLNGLDPKLDARIKETSMVHAIFGGYLQSKVTCHSCKHESCVYEPLLDLSLEVRSANSIHAALKQFTACEILSKQNRYRCESCSKLTDASKQFKIHEAPNILTIHLKRFQMMMPYGGMTKLQKDIEFPAQLDLTQFMSNPKTKVIYDLYGVLVHEGQSCNSGHYHCFVKHSNGVWYSMNDESVHQVSQQTVLRQKAYVLFYQKRTSAKRESEEDSFVPTEAKKAKTAAPVKKTEEPTPMPTPKSMPASGSGSPVASPVKKTKLPPTKVKEEEEEVELDNIISKSMWHLKRFVNTCTSTAPRLFPSWTVTEIPPSSPARKNPKRHANK